MQTLFENFIKEKLDIDSCDIKFFSSWKINFTSLVKSDQGDFVVQNNINISEAQKQVIDKTTDFWSKNWLRLAWKKFEDRFFEFDWKQFQVMEHIKWNSYDYEDFNIFELENVVRYLAVFHNVFEKWDFEEFSQIKNNTKNLDYFLEIARKHSEANNEYEDVFNQLDECCRGLKSVEWVRKWVLHWDPILRNFLFDDHKNILWLIDYDMITYDDLLWDLVDHIRGYLKYYNFKKEDFERLINAYEQIRPLTQIEKDNLENYLKMILLNTTIRYFISLFDSNFFAWKKLGTWLESVHRGLAEFKKVEGFFR